MEEGELAEDDVRMGQERNCELGVDNPVHAGGDKAAIEAAALASEAVIKHAAGATPKKVVVVPGRLVNVVL